MVYVWDVGVIPVTFTLTFNPTKVIANSLFLDKHKILCLKCETFEKVLLSSRNNFEHLFDFGLDLIKGDEISNVARSSPLEFMILDAIK